MRGCSSLRAVAVAVPSWPAVTQLSVWQQPSRTCRQCRRRGIQISSAPVTEFPKPSTGAATGDAFGSATAGDGRDDADARFEVLGSPYSLLSVSLSASQQLYTRRGTLVAVAGKVENAQSTLSLQSPVRGAALGLPFLYQRISSTTPLKLLIGTRAASTTLFTLHLDGTTDWVVAQRRALLAWTGHTLAVTPQRQRFGRGGAGGGGLGLAHWGSSFVTGRGLVALAAPGYIYPVTLAAGEELVVHPSHVVAYAVGRNAPQPFRLRTRASGGVETADSGSASTAPTPTTTWISRLRLQVPAVPTLPEGLTRFWTAMRQTDTYRLLARALFGLRTVLRRSVWGDRLFVHVHGPTTLLLSSRGVRVADVLTRDDVNEIADTEAGAVPAAIESLARSDTDTKAEPASATTSSTTAIHVATVRSDGKVAFNDAKDLKDFVR